MIEAARFEYAFPSLTGCGLSASIAIHQKLEIVIALIPFAWALRWRKHKDRISIAVGPIRFYVTDRTKPSFIPNGVAWIWYQGKWYKLLTDEQSLARFFRK